MPPFPPEEAVSREISSTILEDRFAVISVKLPDLREHMDADFRVPTSTLLEDREPIFCVPPSTILEHMEAVS
jgi:hypothetical protein